MTAENINKADAKINQSFVLEKFSRMLPQISKYVSFDLEKAILDGGAIITSSDLYIIKKPESPSQLTFEAIKWWALPLLEIYSKHMCIAKDRAEKSMNDNDMLTIEHKEKVRSLYPNDCIMVDFDFIRETLTAEQVIIIYNGEIHFINSMPELTSSKCLEKKQTTVESLIFENKRTAYISKLLAW
jgi:hypothetical protein